VQAKKLPEVRKDIDGKIGPLLQTATILVANETSSWREDRKELSKRERAFRTA